jgi:hypothetical protein
MRLRPVSGSADTGLSRVSAQSCTRSSGDPEIYAAGYVMHRCPTSVDDAVSLARERFMAG